MHAPKASDPQNPADAPNPHNARPRAPTPSLAPKEHGAYGQMALPLLTALVARPPKIAPYLLAMAVLAVFFAHEPMLVLIGHRGSKAKRELGPAARQRLLILSALALLFGGAGLLLSPFEARIAVGAPVLGVALLLPLIRAKREKTLAGESLAAATLCSASLPVALASGLPLRDALGLGFSFTMALAAATWAVRSVIHANKHASSAESSSWVRSLPVLAYGAVAVLFPWLGLLAWSSVAAALPMLLFSLYLCLRPPPRQRLRRVGFGLLCTSMFNALFLIIVHRLPGS